MNDQTAYWNGLAGQRWVEEQVRMDRMLLPFGNAALDAAHPQSGESVLDVGCGCGDTSLALASRVGPTGRVVGLDVSQPMVARARQRNPALSTLSFVEGDAGQDPLEQGAFDLLFSRFGVMFFPDPTGAFTHLREALRPGGRVTFVCWRLLRENPWATIPFEAACAVLGRPDPSPPDAPGPFSLGDATRVQHVLEAAGLRDVSLQPFDATMAFGTGGPLDDAAREIARMGPVARLLVDRDEDTIAKAVAAVASVLPPYVSPEGGVRFTAATWLVTARNVR